MTSVIQTLGANFPNSINNTLCMARKNQKNEINVQCPNKKKFGDYCGKHKNYDIYNLTRIDTELRSDYQNQNGNGNQNENQNDNENENVDNTYLNNVIEAIDTTTLFGNIKNSITWNDNTYCFPNRISKKNKTQDNTGLKSVKKHKYTYNTKPLYPLQLLDYLISPELDRTDSIIRKTCKYYKLLPTKTLKQTTVGKLKIILSNFFDTLLSSIINLKKIIKLQKNIRKWIKNNKFKLNGPAVYNRKICNNSTDFYSFDDIKEIPNEYFFSFKDKDGFIYGFHIESFIQLINQSSNSRNPYNRANISNDIKKRAREMWFKLENSNKKSNHIVFNESSDIKVRVRTKCLTVFQMIDMFGYQTNIDWILRLSISRLRSLYKSLDNYWYFRAGITDEMRYRIVPDSDLFTTRDKHQVNRHIDKYVIIEIIINVIQKMVSHGITEEDKQTGCIIVLMAMGEIVSECSRSNPWMI